ncbi:MAG: leucine-rich repeat domain-containing protein [Prevotella sp.]|nr:leucine-rich repeat domain-containing protein [Prevotella sp.]
MKKTFKFLSLAMLLSFVGAVSALAQQITGNKTYTDDNDIEYTVTAITASNNGTTITKATVAVTNNGTPKFGQDEVRIPGTVQFAVSGTTDNGQTLKSKMVTFTVTSVVNFGYANKNGVKKFEIPCSVEEIGEDAFHNAASEENTNLEIVFGWDGTKSKLKKIGNFAFGNSSAQRIDLSKCNELDLTGTKPFLCRGTQKNKQLKEVILSTGIQYIGQAFAGLPKLETLDLSKTKVTVLEDGALANTNLSEVTIPAVKNPTVLTTKIGSKAFENSPIETLTINAPIAVDGAIAADAFYGMPELVNLNLNGELDAVGAIPSNAFPNSSKLNKVIVKGEVKKAGAIAENAFAKNPNISEVTFTKPIWAGGIGEDAFAGIGQDDCAKVNFAALNGAAAIGTNAFLGAGISELNFNGAIYADAIAFNAFKSITCGAVVEFKGNIGEGGIGQYAFEEAFLSTLTFDQPIASEQAIAPFAFTKANITAITFKRPVTAINGIGNYAFFAFTNSTGTTPVLFENGGIKLANGIGAHAFDKGAVGSLTIEGNLKGANSIDEYAFANTPITEFTLNGQVANTNAIAFGAFAKDTKLAKINLNGEIYTADETEGAHAIQAGAFFGAGNENAELNIGDLKMSEAIEAGAFASATFKVVNFSRLMAKRAIAANQFGPMNRALSRQMVPGNNKSGVEGTEISSNGDYATVKTVNFNEPFQQWPEATDNALQGFIGNNAFSGTKVSTVNFNAEIACPYAIYAKTYKSSKTANPEYAAASPFANNGADLTINFKAGVVESGVGPYAFANSKLVEINLDSKSVYEEKAFMNHSFYYANYNGEAANPAHVVINFTPDKDTQIFRAFNLRAFYDDVTVIDVQFKTTKDVLSLYTTDNNTEDYTPYRIKGIASKIIELVWSDKENAWVGVFTPENEMYVIKKYQNDSEVGVWSAYYDDKTLTKKEGKFFDLPVEDTQKYKADLYINPLRVQDGGLYVINPGHTLIITSSNSQYVTAEQDLGKHQWGGVQTFAGLSPWSCNDLRWNPAEIFPVYNNAGVVQNYPWGGYISYVAIDNECKDYYGNQINEYKLFRAGDFETKGIAFGHDMNLPESWLYMLVTNDRNKRVKYSTGYITTEDAEGNTVVVFDENGEAPLNTWFTKLGMPWEKSLDELLADAVREANKNAAAAATGQATAESMLKDIIEKLQKAAGTDDAPSTETDPAKLIKAIIEKGYNNRVAENVLAEKDIKRLADDLAEKVVAYAKALCNLRVAKLNLANADRIPAAEADKEPYNFTGKFSENEERINGNIETIQGTIDELDDYLTVAAGDEQGDDMYKQYLALKAVAGNSAEAQALIDWYENLPSEVTVVIENSGRTNPQIQALQNQTDEEGTTYYDLYYAWRNAYLAWSKQTPNPLNSFVFNEAELEEGAEVSDTELDAALNNSILPNNVDLPSAFKKSLEDAAEEAERIADIYENYEKAEEALAKDAHAQAFYNTLVWSQKTHVRTILRANDMQDYSNNIFEIECAPEPKLNKEIGGTTYYAWKIYQKTSLAADADVDDLPDVLYSDEEYDLNYALGYDGDIYYFNNGAMELFTVDGYLTDWWTNSDQTTDVTETNDWTVALPTNPESPLLPSDLYTTEWDEFGDPVNPEDEVKLVYDMVMAKTALLNEQLDLNDAEEAKEDAEEARAKANNWLIEWYALADHYYAGASQSVTFTKEVQKLAAEEALAKAQAELEALKAIEDPYGGNAYEHYAAALDELGTPAVEDEDATPDVDESADATKKYLAVEETKAAKDLAVKALKDAVNGIDAVAESIEGGARLNIIWNDRPSNEVVGIMEAVANGAVVKDGDNIIYNLNGMRVKNTGKGIYIQNGVKVIK